MHIPRGLLILDEMSVSVYILFRGVGVKLVAQILCRSGMVTQCPACTNTTELGTKQRAHTPTVTPKAFEKNIPVG